MPRQIPAPLLLPALFLVGGVGVVWYAIEALTGMSNPAPVLEFRLDFSPIGLLFGYAHHAFAASALLCVVALWSISLERRAVQLALASGAIAAVLIGSVPYLIAVVAALPVVSLVALRVARGPHIPLRFLAAYLTPLLAATLLLVAPLIGGNDVAAQRFAQNVHSLPPAQTLLLALGPMGVVSGIGLWLRRAELRVRDTILIAWAVSHAAALFLPLPFAYRISQGLGIPFALLAVAGLTTLWGQRQRIAWSIPVTALAVFPMAANSLAIPVALGYIGARVPAEWRYYSMLPSEFTALQRWIQLETPSTGVFVGQPAISSLVAAYAHRPTLVAHPVESPYFWDRYGTLRTLEQTGDLGALRTLSVRYSALFWIADARVDGIANQALFRFRGFPVVFQSGPFTVMRIQ